MARSLEEVCQVLAEGVLIKERILVLLLSKGKSTEAAQAFRQYLTETMDAGKLLKPAKTNPDFVRLTTNGWAFFIACEDMTIEDEIGTPDYVMWASDGGLYEKVRYQDWRKLKTERQCVFRPVDAFEGPDVEPGSIWDKLSNDEDFG